MYIESDIKIGNEQAKMFAQYVYDDFIEYMKSKKDDKEQNNNTTEVN